MRMKDELLLKKALLTGLILAVFFGIIFSCDSKQKKDSNVSELNENRTSNHDIGVALYSFNRFSFSRTLDMAKQAGTDLVEGFFFHNLGEEYDNKSMLEMRDQELRDMKNMIDRKGLRMPSVYAGGKNEDEWERFFEIGQILGLEFLVCEPEPEYWDLLDSLGQANNLKIAIHEHARGKSRFWHPDSALVAVEGRSSFGVCGDLGHWVRSGLDPVECLRKLEGHLISIHAKDLDEFGDLKANDVKIGTGVIDYDGVIAELNRQEFSGPIFIECEHDWDDNLEDVKYAVDYLEKLIYEKSKSDER